ncbi:UbiH/UbiF family hydroxylase [Paludibacterium denitrificans]|uniref:UbiH/UbiF family hydroxylase n=1 Tax=Paludibacterium denitrificans TaxID=2675226 RepID=A0A844GCD0_9NEIS|nr:UbiH/UbiF family hydroxylase [Paludibacterium denitrificans]MTD32567.1 UbiH/UbiF family hydroxylase [Paludibacterium denitrificans]
MARQHEFDVIVVGGGLVGASLALALADSGKAVALLEGQNAQFDQLEQGWDARIYAVSPANRRFLERLQAWPDSSRLGTIASMDVRGDAGGRLQFAASDVGESALAWIAENRWMLAALWRRLAESSITCLTGVRPVQLECSATAACLTLDDGRPLTAALVVGADGANSRLRQQCGLQASVKPYGHSGVVANFACERPHGDIARQWFTGDSILAWLPMAGNRISMVWSTSDPQRLLDMDHDTLAETVAAAGNHELGALQLLTPAVAFPLRLIQPESVISQRVALVGDAAHTVHPLAGQGVNTGFQDAEQLARLLATATDVSEYLILRRYERERREAVKTMQLACDALFQLFHARQPGVSWLRNTGLTLTNRLSVLKRQFVRHAMGV